MSGMSAAGFTSFTRSRMLSFPCTCNSNTAACEVSPRCSAAQRGTGSVLSHEMEMLLGRYCELLPEHVLWTSSDAQERKHVGAHALVVAVRPCRGASQQYGQRYTMRRLSRMSSMENPTT